MNNFKITVQKGITQFVILIVMGLLAVALPVATKLVQQNQENRSKAVVVKKTEEYCHSKQNYSDCEDDPGCYYATSVGYGAKNCVPAKIFGEDCYDNRVCYTDGSLSCKEGKCINQGDCIHKESRKVIRDGSSLCWNWEVFICSNGKLTSVNCDDYKVISPNIVGCSGSLVGSCNFSTALKSPATNNTCSSYSGTCKSACLSTEEEKIGVTGCTGSLTKCCVKKTTTTECNDSKIGQKKCWYNSKSGKNEVLECKKTGTDDEGEVYAYVQYKVCTGLCTTSGTNAFCADVSIDTCKSGSYTRNKGTYLCFSDGRRKCISQNTWEAIGTLCPSGQVCKNTTTSADCVAVTSTKCVSGDFERSIGKFLCVNSTRNECISGSMGPTWNSANSRCQTGYKCLNTTDSAKCVQCLVDTDCTSGKKCVNNVCGGGTTTGTVSVTGITLDPAEWTMKISETKLIVAIVTPSNATNKNVTWLSSDTSVATVDSSGLVTALKIGEIKIKATSVSKTSIFKELNLKVVTCDANAKKCENEDKMVCKTDGSGWNTTDCGTPGCNEDTGECNSQTAEQQDSELNFKFVFDGVKAGAECISDLSDLEIVVASRLIDNAIQSKTVSFSETDETDSHGNQVFEVKGLSLDKTIFGTVNSDNYVKIKGPLHGRIRYCLNNQSTVIGDKKMCNIDLHSGTLYDFTKYPLAPGDVNHDGVINAVDYSIVAGQWNSDGCGIDEDLNKDGIVNMNDLSLVMKYLLKDDE